MTKILNFALKIKGVVGRVAHVKSSDPATPPPKKNVHIGSRTGAKAGGTGKISCFICYTITKI